jgi:hypothetical protein
MRAPLPVNSAKGQVTRGGANGTRTRNPLLAKSRNQARQASVSKRQNAGGRSMTL